MSNSAQDYSQEVEPGFYFTDDCVLHHRVIESVNDDWSDLEFWEFDNSELDEGLEEYMPVKYDDIPFPGDVKVAVIETGEFENKLGFDLEDISGWLDQNYDTNFTESDLDVAGYEDNIIYLGRLEE